MISVKTRSKSTILLVSYTNMYETWSTIGRLCYLYALVNKYQTIC